MRKLGAAPANCFLTRNAWTHIGRKYLWYTSLGLDKQAGDSDAKGWVLSPLSWVLSPEGLKPRKLEAECLLTTPTMDGNGPVLLIEQKQVSNGDRCEVATWPALTFPSLVPGLRSPNPWHVHVQEVQAAERTSICLSVGSSCLAIWTNLAVLHNFAPFWPGLCILSAKFFGLQPRVLDWLWCCRKWTWTWSWTCWTWAWWNFSFLGLSQKQQWGK